MLTNHKFSITVFAAMAAIVAGTLFFTSCESEPPVDYNAQIKPILNKRCISCHGGVKQSGGFNLLTRELAMQPSDSGHPTIIPGDANASEMIRRLLIDDPEERMPYEAAPLPKEEIQLLKKWIDQGAEWGTHWAYETVVKPDIPESVPVALGYVGKKDEGRWANNEIDQFILEKMKPAGLAPNSEADKPALLRRVSLDLTGLPAPKSLAEKFLDNENPISYPALVDSLLASPHFGERWASMWLDLARYADSKGFERDFSRNIWEYRDYVIRAFNKDLPYDQFITEQIAGDLLPNPTDDQYIATGFHRNTTTNDEGGTDNEEFRVAAVVDRVNTTWEAILGTTFACVQCHGHPYDPFFHDDYYEFMAFLNNTRDSDTHMDYPLLRRFSDEELAKLESLENWVAEVESPERAEDIKTFIKTWQPTIYSIETDSFINSELYDTKYLGFRQNGWARLGDLDLTGKNRLIFKAKTGLPDGQFTIYLDKPNGKKLIATVLPNTKWKDEFFELSLEETQGIHDLYFNYYNPNLKDPDRMTFQVDWFHFTSPFPGKGDPQFADKQKDFWNLMKAKTPTTLIMVENPDYWERETHIFDRGNWTTKTDKVEPKVPDIFEPLPSDAPKNRLGLAQWLTDPSNPLTARTIVNRYWEQLFGMGLAETLEDFGTQGIPPTHPQLLDWLSWKFMNDFQWSTKKMLRLMVLSATYRQSSTASQEKLDADPYNKFYTRGPRVRLSAEQIRDQALVVSGLLNPEMYGPPVMPYQPKNLWQTPYNNQRWEKDEGEDAHRRAIYTFMKRSTPYPSFETFDVAPRQVCVARRIRTNTPLQALVTLNDPVYVEAAQHLAKRMEKSGGTSIEQRIQAGYQLAIGQAIENSKLQVLKTLYQKAYDDFENAPTEAEKMVGKVEVNPNEVSETAAMVVVANAIMNLDEFLTR